jgi:hypothetical protein
MRKSIIHVCCRKRHIRLNAPKISCTRDRMSVAMVEIANEIPISEKQTGTLLRKTKVERNARLRDGEERNEC